jgi:hypothetical protein
MESLATQLGKQYNLAIAKYPEHDTKLLNQPQLTEKEKTQWQEEKQSQ